MRKQLIYMEHRKHLFDSYYSNLFDNYDSHIYQTPPLPLLLIGKKL